MKKAIYNIMHVVMVAFMVIGAFATAGVMGVGIIESIYLQFFEGYYYHMGVVEWIIAVWCFLMAAFWVCATIRKAIGCIKERKDEAGA